MWESVRVSEDAIGDSGCGDGGADVVDAEDVGSGEDGGGVGDGGGKPGVSGVGGERAGEEALAGEAGEDGEPEGVELVEVGEQGIVLVEDFAEAEAGVEGDGIAGDPGGECGVGSVLQVAQHQRQHL